MKKISLLLPALLVAALTFPGCTGTTSSTTTEGPSSEDATPADETAAEPATGEETEAVQTTPETASEDSPATPSDIVDTAVAAEGFSTLVAAVKAAGLVETLKGEGPFTVFAPTDEAFAKLPEGTLDDLLKPENKDKLTAILTYHVVPGKVMAADVVSLTSAKTVQGGEATIAVADGKVKIDAANVVKTDIECSNGVIHVIDAVILPAE